MKTVLLFIISVLATMNLFAQLNWMNYAGNPVIDSTMDPSSKSTSAVAVHFDGTIYRLWYTRNPGTSKENIGYATSTNGTSWTLVDSLAFVPSEVSTRFDSKKVGHGSVVKENDTLKMWYWGEGQNLGNIGYAWSLDGHSWTRVDGSGEGKSVFDKTMDGTGAVALAAPCVIKDGSVYRMWYTKIHYVTGIIWRIGYATSPDGLHWTSVAGSGTNGAVIDLGTVGNFDEGSVLYASVVKKNNTFQMWYTGTDNTGVHIGYATSTDGINWTKVGGAETRGSCIGDGAGHAVLADGDGYKIWYRPGAAGKSVQYATSSGVSGVESETVPASFGLQQNYPNPFNPSTVIQYQLLSNSWVTLKVYNILGKEVATLVDGLQNAGNKTVTLDATGLSSGLYFYRLEATSAREYTNRFVEMKKMLYIK